VIQSNCQSNTFLQSLNTWQYFLSICSSKEWSVLYSGALTRSCLCYHDPYWCRLMFGPNCSCPHIIFCTLEDACVHAWGVPWRLPLFYTSTHVTLKTDNNLGMKKHWGPSTRSVFFLQTSNSAVQNCTVRTEHVGNICGGSRNNRLMMCWSPEWKQLTKMQIVTLL
jgi:hypothetical protein